MKKIYFIILSLLMLPAAVFAAGSASLSVPGTVENGSNVTATLTLSNTAAWNVKITGSGATSGCTAAYADATEDAKNTTKTFNVTCRATKEGTITFVATGDITSQDGATTIVNVSKSVTVVKPRERDTENRLSSLTIEGFEIDFDKDKTEYELEVDYKVESLTIEAIALSKKARVTVNNPEYIKFGSNEVTVVVTSESGVDKTYVVKVVKNEPVMNDEGCVTPAPQKCDEPKECASNAGWIIAVSVESVLLLALLGYVLYDKKFKK